MPAEKPHYLQHRDRLRERFKNSGKDALADYELLELYLFNSIPRRDVKPVAKALIERFGSFAETIAAPLEHLIEVKGVGDKTALDLKIIQAIHSVVERIQHDWYENHKRMYQKLPEISDRREENGNNENQTNVRPCIPQAGNGT